MTVKKLVIAAEVFSKNTGDQVIYQCLRHMFLQLSPSLTVKPLDISGRSPDMRMDYMVQFGGLPSRLGYLAAHIMGSLVNYSLYRIYKNYPKHLNAWRPVLHNVDRVLIGGGQLFMDNRLDFPIKLFSLSRELTSRKIPYYIGACGVGEHWSSLGRFLFAKVLKESAGITVRNSLSQQRLHKHLGDIQSQVTFDPAIWAANVYPRIKMSPPEHLLMGLGVINRHDVNLHLPLSKRFTAEAWMQLWLGLIAALQSLQLPIEIFTSGTPADTRFAGELFTRAKTLGIKKIILAPDPVSPQQFVSILQAYTCVVASRMHASIIANAFSIPAIGLVWDEKVRAYYADIQRLELCFDLVNFLPEQIADACSNLLRTGGDPLNLDDFRQRALETAHIVLKD